MRPFLLGSLIVGCCSVTTLGAITTFNVTLSGAQEVPGPGDPDGAGSGTISFDPDNDTITWSIDYTNVTGTNMSGFHIHGPLPDPPAQQSASIRVFLDSVPGALGPVPNGTLANMMTTANDANLGAKIDEILANPTKYYLNIHTSPNFPSGAIRGTVPEPASLVLLIAGTLCLVRRRWA